MVPHATHFFSLLDKTFLLNARVQMLQYILSANIWALPFFYSFIENETKQRSNWLCVREEAEGRMEACNPLNLEHHTFSICLYWKGALIQSHLCFWLFLFPYS